MAQIRADNRENYVILLDLLAKANDSVEGLSISDITEGERLFIALWLAHKFIGHALTVLNLSRGYKVEELPSVQPVNFTDYWSIDVLTRAAMEAFLIFHYVFFAPTTTEEKEYRYWAYKAAGLAERKNFPTTTEEGSRTLADDKIELDALQNKLKSNAIFQSLANSQKRQIFEGKGAWKWKPDGKGRVSWREIAIDVGFSEILASHMYRLLSGYAHSSYLSVLQMAQALLDRKQEIDPSTINTMNIVIANMIREYCRLFSKAQDVLSKDLEGNKLVEQYIQIGRILDKYMGMGQNNE